MILYLGDKSKKKWWDLSDFIFYFMKNYNSEFDRDIEDSN